MELIDKLREMVIQHQVCYQVFPAEELFGGKIQRVGFNLEIYGTHYHPAHTPSPGCGECVKVYKDLYQIAEWVIPKVERKSWYNIGLFHGDIGYTGLRQFRPEVTVCIEIRHKEVYFEQIDECEIMCLNEMKEKLNMLGAKEGSWI